MAFEILVQPEIIHPAYNPIVFVVNDPENNWRPGFRYLLIIYDLDDNLLSEKFMVPDVTTGYGTFDITQTISDLLSYDIPFGNTGGTETSNSIFQYRIRYGSQHTVSAAFSSVTYSISSVKLNLSEFINPATYLNQKVWVKYVAPLDYEATTQTNVVDADTNYLILTQPYSIVGNTTGWVALSNGTIHTIVYDEENTYTTFNAAYGFQDFINYDATTIPMQGQTSIFLTDAPRTGFTIKPWQQLFWNVYDNGWNEEYMVIAENSNGETYKLPFTGTTNADNLIQLNVGPDAGWETFVEYPYSAATLPLVKDDTEWYTIKVSDGRCLGECDEVQIVINFNSPFPSTTETAYRTAQTYNGKSVYEFFIGAQRYTIFFESYNSRWTIKQDGVIYNLAELTNNCGCSLVRWRYNDGVGTYSGVTNLYITNSNYPSGHIQYGFSFATPNVSKNFYVTYNTTNWKVTDYTTGSQVAHSTSYTLCPAGLVYVPETISPFLNLDIDACIKDCPTSVDYGLWIINTSDYPLVSGITSNIFQCYGEQQITEEFKINIDQSCQSTDTQILFLDRKGSWSSFAFPLKVTQAIDSSKVQYNSFIGHIDGSQWTWNTWDSVKRTINVDVTKQYKLTTHWLNDAMDMYFQELITSPVTYVYLDGKWIGCDILDKALEPITRRLKQRTITIQLSTQDTINI